MRRMFAEPMLHFLVIGLALFGSYRWMAPDDAAGHRIVITQGIVNDLVSQHQAVRGREPSDAELRHLIESYVRDEILYREGARLGLDKDDAVVKRRVRQKIEVMAEEEGAATTPTDSELATYLAANQSLFARPAVLSFDQIFLGPADSAAAVARAVALTGDAVRRSLDPENLGQPSILPRQMSSTDADIVARTFGASFVVGLEKATLGEWIGPIASDYGVHYVRVTERTPATMPRLAEVRERVVREWENDRRRRAREDSYRKARASYDIVVEGAVPAQP